MQEYSYAVLHRDFSSPNTDVVCKASFPRKSLIWCTIYKKTTAAYTEHVIAIFFKNPCAFVCIKGLQGKFFYNCSFPCKNQNHVHILTLHTRLTGVSLYECEHLTKKNVRNIHSILFLTLNCKKMFIINHTECVKPFPSLIWVAHVRPQENRK